MTELPPRLYTAEQVRRLDQFCIESYGIPGIDLMRRAGKAVFELLRSQWPQIGSIHVVCGGGNNGGDGFVVAELARAAGLEVDLWAARPMDQYRGDARIAAESFAKAGGQVRELNDYQSGNAELVVDALLGTGLSSEVSGTYAAVIQSIAKSAVPVLAVDVPSGLNSDTGCVMGCALPAAATMSFIGLKQGLLTADALEYVGVLHFDGLGAPDQAYDAVPCSARSVAITPASHGLPDRPLNSHKGMFGHLVLVGGDEGMPGSVRLAGEAALRCGAGLVTLGTHPGHAQLVTSSRPELMSMAARDAGALEALLAKSTVVAVGPGLGRTAWSSMCFEAAMETDRPMVIDADGLYWLAQSQRQVPRAVLTPHPGEAAMLLGTSTREVQSDRYAAAHAVADRYQAVCVLKGAGTIICSPDESARVCGYANPAMASAGMGDVLTGVVGALLAQGLSANEAAEAAVVLHYAAGAQAAAGRQRGLLASDLAPELYRLINA